MELTIGYHLLEGKMMDLKKPFAILEKQSAPVDVDALERDGAGQCSTEYKVCTWLENFISCSSTVCHLRKLPHAIFAAARYPTEYQSPMPAGTKNSA